MPAPDLLLLRRAERPRPPTRRVGEDYDVIRQHQTIGRIWMHDYRGAVSGPLAHHLWHWEWRGVSGKPDTDGNAPTLGSAMADFRRAWDTSGA